jgi:excisionase family DNA binding protein
MGSDDGDWRRPRDRPATALPAFQSARSGLGKRSRPWRIGVIRPSPTLTDLVINPSCIADLAPDEARGLLVQLMTLQVPLLAKALAQPPETKADTQALLLVPDAAARLGVESSYLYELIRQGRVPAVRLGPKYVRLHPSVVAEIQERGLASALSQPYSRTRDGRGASTATRDENPNGVRGTVGRAREHTGALRTRRPSDPRARGPAREASEP